MMNSRYHKAMATARRTTKAIIDMGPLGSYSALEVSKGTQVQTHIAPLTVSFTLFVKLIIASERGSRIDEDKNECTGKMHS